MEVSPSVDPTAEVSVVNPWEVKGKVDYDKLIRDFGCGKIDQVLLDRIERVTKKPVHPLLKREIFFSHRYNNNKKNMKSKKEKKRRKEERKKKRRKKRRKNKEKKKKGKRSRTKKKTK